MLTHILAELVKDSFWMLLEKASITGHSSNAGLYHADLATFLREKTPWIVPNRNERLVSDRRNQDDLQFRIRISKSSFPQIPVKYIQIPLFKWRWWILYTTIWDRFWKSWCNSTNLLPSNIRCRLTSSDGISVWCLNDSSLLNFTTGRHGQISHWGFRSQTLSFGVSGCQYDPKDPVTEPCKEPKLEGPGTIVCLFVCFFSVFWFWFTGVR